MNIIRINVDNYHFEFVCNSRNTRHGFAHDCNLFLDIAESHARSMTESHCYYYNRTWERWTYQTVCITAINQLIEEHTNALKFYYLNNHNYKKMTKKRLPDFMAILDNDTALKIYKACKDNLMHNVY